MSASDDEGQILQDGLDLAAQCATAMMLDDRTLVYDLLDTVNDPKVLHTAFIYAITQWAHAMEVFMEEGEWAQWLLSKELQHDDQG